jgi:hypothetical protein
VIAFDRITIELCDPVPRSLPAGSVAIETDPGKVIDKITILEINADAIGDGEQLRDVRTEPERKPLHGQAIGRHPDSNDGVHMAA